MSKTSTESLHDSADELIDRWLAHHRPPVEGATAAEPGGATAPGAAEQVVEPEEVARPELGGAADAPSALGTEIAETPANLHAASLPPQPTGASVPTEPPAPTPAPNPAPALPGVRPRVLPRPAAAAQPPGLVIFSPRRGARPALTVVVALLAAGAAATGYQAWQSREPNDVALAAGLALALLLAWTLRRHTHGSAVTIENGVLRIVQGNSRHLFPLVGTHPPVSILGQPGRRGWKVLIHRRGMPPFVVDRRMVEPVAFTEALRHFRPEA